MPVSELEKKAESNIKPNRISERVEVEILSKV